jgi:hypothetical protein
MKKLAIALITFTLLPCAFGATISLGEFCKNQGEFVDKVSVIEWKGNLEVSGKVNGKKVTAILAPKVMRDYGVDELVQEFRFNMKDGYTTDVELTCDYGTNNVSDWDMTYTPKE